MYTPPLAISTLAIILIVLAVLIAIALLLGLLGIRARNRRQAGSYAEHVAQADSALEQARASDRGWHREVMEGAARGALERERPGLGVLRTAPRAGGRQAWRRGGPRSLRRGR